MLIDPRKQAAIRLSVVSCITEDSVDSTGLKTPIDVSPPMSPRNNAVTPIINIVDVDPLPNNTNYPDVAYVNRRRAQTSPRPVPASIIRPFIPQEQPTIISSSSKPKESYNFGRFWPKIKRSILVTDNSGQHKRWFKNKNRIYPQ